MQKHHTYFRDNGHSHVHTVHSGHFAISVQCVDVAIAADVGEVHVGYAQFFARTLSKNWLYAFQCDQG